MTGSGVVERRSAAHVLQLGGTAVVLSIVALAYNLAFAAIIYRGELAHALPIGLGIALMAQMVGGVFVAVRSSLRGHFVGPQDTPAIVLAPAAASLAAIGAAAVPTVIALAALSTLAVGVVLWLIGRLGLGGLLRYLPYPVVAGFLGGLGLVVLVSAFNVGVAEDGWLDGRAVARWLPALALGATLTAVSRRWPNRPLLMPALTLGVMPLSHVVLAIAGLNIGQAQERGLLLGPFDSGVMWQPADVWQVGQIDWGAMAGQLTTMVPLLVLYPLTILMNLAAFDHQTKVEPDVDDDLRLNGLANLLVAPFGATAVGTHLGESTLSWRLAGSSRLVAVATALINGLVVLIGGTVLGLIPAVVVQGMLFFLGLSFVTDWLWDTRWRLPRGEYGLVMFMALVILIFDFTVGVAVGILVAVLLFVVRYSRIGAVRHRLTSRERRSNVQWGDEAGQLLDARGDRSLILELDGFLFFGSAARVLEPVAERVAAGDVDRAPLEVLVIDFHRVVGVDSDAALSFEKLIALTDANDVAVAMCGLTPDDRQHLVRSSGSWAERVHFEPDLDRALHWCEARLIGSAADPDALAGDLQAVLIDHLGDTEAATRLLARWERRQVEAGTNLVVEGGPGQGLMAIEAGTVSIYRPSTKGEAEAEAIAGLSSEGRESRRIRTLRSGSLLGEMSLYGDGIATATATADTAVTYLHLSPEAFERLEAEDPALALALHHLLGRVLLERMAHADALIAAILRPGS